MSRPVTAPSAPEADATAAPRLRWRRLAVWFAILTALGAWAATQPPTRMEPVDWVGTLDI